MRKTVDWTQKLEGGVRREVRVSIGSGRVKWQFYRSDVGRWDYTTPPTAEEWDELLARMESRYFRRRVPFKDLELIRKCRAGLLVLVWLCGAAAAGAATNAADAATTPLPRTSRDLRDAMRVREGSRFGADRARPSLAHAANKERRTWKGELEAGVNTARGNSDSLRYSLGAILRRETPTNALSLGAKGEYGQSSGEKDTERGTVEGKWEHALSSASYTVANALFFHDGMADVHYRVQGFLSAGLYLLRTDASMVNMEIGPGYLKQRKGDETEGFMVGRGGLNTATLLTPYLLVFSGVEYIPSLADHNVYFVNAEAGLECAVFERVSLRFLLQDRYDSAPAEDKKSNDLLTATTLRLRW